MEILLWEQFPYFSGLNFLQQPCNHSSLGQLVEVRFAVHKDSARRIFTTLKHKAVIYWAIHKGRPWELLSEAVLVRHAMIWAVVSRWGPDRLCSPLEGAGSLRCSVVVFQLHVFPEELDVFSSQCFSS